MINIVCSDKQEGTNGRATGRSEYLRFTEIRVTITIFPSEVYVDLDQSVGYSYNSTPLL